MGCGGLSCAFGPKDVGGPVGCLSEAVEQLAMCSGGGVEGGLGTSDFSRGLGTASRRVDLDLVPRRASSRDMDGSGSSSLYALLMHACMQACMHAYNHTTGLCNSCVGMVNLLSCPTTGLYTSCDDMVTLLVCRAVMATSCI